MNDTLGLIILGNRGHAWSDSVFALPVAGRYAVIDFVLSSMVNSGIINVGVTSDGGFDMLHEHLRGGAPWDLQRNHLGLHLLPSISGRSYADKIGMIVDFVKKSREKYVLISGAETVFNMKFEDVMKFHKEKGADITVVCTSSRSSNVPSYSEFVYTDNEKRVFGAEKKVCGLSGKDISMNIYLMERRFFIRLAESAKDNRECNSVIDFTLQRLSKINVFAYVFEGFSMKTDNVSSYYECNVSILNKKIRNELFEGENKIFTNVKSCPPAYCTKTSAVRNSLTGDGCIIEGEVYGSILCSGVRVQKGAVIKNSIIMDKNYIGRNCEISYVILKEGCIIKEGTRLCGKEVEPLVFERGTINGQDFISNIVRRNI